MNIFVVDEDPEVAARQLCDKHVVKMILESAQMLCTVALEHGFRCAIQKGAPKASMHALGWQVARELVVANCTWTRNGRGVHSPVRTDTQERGCD